MIGTKQVQLKRIWSSDTLLSVMMLVIDLNVKIIAIQGKIFKVLFLESEPAQNIVEGIAVLSRPLGQYQF